MQRALRIILAVIVPLALVLFTVSFTVRFTETAVVTTFGKATASDVKKDAGLYFKWPYPIQNYTKYDTRTRLLTLTIETQQTSDSRQIAVETFCTWRVQDPLRFFQTFSNAGERADEHYKKAEDALKANLRAAGAVISNYSMDDLFTTQSSKGKLPELEQRMLAAFREASDQQGGKLSDYGVEAIDVGLTRVLLPEEVTKAVFDRMKTGRERLAKEVETKGQSEAQAIRDKATADADRITAFAQNLAAEIRTQGDREAVPFLKQMNQNPELAVFLRNMEFARNMDPRSGTFVLSAQMPGLAQLMSGSLDEIRGGRIPAPRFEDLMQAQAPQDANAKPPVIGGTGTIDAPRKERP